MLQCTVDHRDMLEGKMAFRPFAKIAALMPRGGAQMQVAVPKRKEFGDEGDLGDAAHEAVMQRFSLHSFGTSHVQHRTSERLRL